MKKINLKKDIFKKISFLIAGVFILSLFLIPKFSIKADDNILTDVISIKILEIEPGDLFKLTFTNGVSIDPESNSSYSNKIKIPTSETSAIQVNGKKINITIDHITMPEFVSKINDVDGEYDVVVIGRDNIDSSIGLTSIPKKAKYLDYNNPFSFEISTRVFGNDYSEKEYYSENDITKKRMKEIEESINNNKLVYFDTNIGRTDEYTEKVNWVNEDKTIKNTNLFRLYNLYDSNKINLKKIETNDIKIEKIVNDYLNLSEDYKRPNIYNILSPSGDNDNPYNPENSINLGFTSLNNKSENLTVKVYIDINGDGLFDDNELKKIDKLKCNVGENTYKIQYNIESKYNGYFGWKIVIQKDSGVKTLINGSCIVGEKLYKNHKINIKALHIDISDSFNNELNNKEWDWFNSSSFKNVLEETNYNISFDTFGLNYMNAHPKIIDNYNYIFISGVWNNANQFNDSLIKNLKNYVANGKKLVLSKFAMQIFEYSPKRSNFTKEFRDIVGLSRYKDPDRYGSEKDIDNKSNITHDDTTQLGNNVYSAGVSASYALGDSVFGSGGTMIASAINKNAINSYPFNLDTVVIPNDSASATDFQLNLEDKNVIPLFTLKSRWNTWSDNDARNYSYLFIKGNIGIIPSFRNNNGSYNYASEDEAKLLINLLVNNIQSVDNNSNPDILSNKVDKPLNQIGYENGKYNLSDYESSTTEMNENSVIELNSIEKGFNFITTVSDPDDDKVKITNIKINDADINSNMIDNGKDLMDDYKESGSQIGISISKDYLDNIKNTQSKEITIKIYVEDENGGKSIATYIIKLKNIMTIDHGLYKGLNSNSIIEDLGEDNIKTFSTGTLVTFGVLLDGINKSNSIEIKFDDKLTDNNITKIQIYYVNSNNTLELISNNSKVTNNKYILSSLDTSGRKILIIYNEQLPTNINKDNDRYVNKILVDNEDVNKPAIIRINEKLPDLF